MVPAFHTLSTSALRALAASLDSGMLSAGLTQVALEQIAGPHTPVVQAELVQLLQQGFTNRQISVLLAAIVESRRRYISPAQLFERVLSGPDLPGVPTADTAAAVQTLVEQASQEILLVGYAIHDGKSLFSTLAARIRQTPELRVTFCIDIPRPWGDRSSDEQLVQEFAREFRVRHWPWSELPAVYFYRRSLVNDASLRASMHAKCVIVDRAQGLVTSANFTPAGQYRNIEAGLLVRHGPTITRLVEYFVGLMASNELVRCPLTIAAPS